MLPVQASHSPFAHELVTFMVKQQQKKGCILFKSIIYCVVVEQCTKINLYYFAKMICLYIVQGVKESILM